METKKEFTLEDGIRIQKQGLESWRMILKTDCFKQLLDECNADNKALRDIDNNSGYSVLRGQRLYEFVVNVIMKREREKREEIDRADNE